MFQVKEETSLGEPKLKKFIGDTTGLTLKPRFEVVAALQEVDDEAPGLRRNVSPAAGDAAPPVAGPSAYQSIVALNKLSPAIRRWWRCIRMQRRHPAAGGGLPGTYQSR